MLDLSRARDRMVEVQVARRGVRDRHVLDAMRRVPREAFVEPGFEEFAYEDGPLPIGEGQTISQPFVVALMTQELDLDGTEHVLEIGTGSGYQTAILAELAGDVVSVERHPPLLEQAQRTLTGLGYSNFELHLTNATLGWPQRAPYDRVVVTAAATEVPVVLLDQLSTDGRMVIPVGPPKAQDLLLLTRQQGRIERRRLGPVRFVPLIAEG
jgi:protein-L-isoaspartate(D-aspartate) O-methyltransferase